MKRIVTVVGMFFIVVLCCNELMAASASKPVAIVQRPTADIHFSNLCINRIDDPLLGILTSPDGQRYLISVYINSNNPALQSIPMEIKFETSYINNFGQPVAEETVFMKKTSNLQTGWMRFLKVIESPDSEPAVMLPYKFKATLDPNMLVNETNELNNIIICNEMIILEDLDASAPNGWCLTNGGAMTSSYEGVCYFAPVN